VFAISGATLERITVKQNTAPHLHRLSAAAPTPKSIFLIGPAYPYRGGIAQFLQVMSAGLSERGHRVKTVTFRRQYPALFFPGKSQFVPHPSTDSFAAVRLIDTIQPWSWCKTARQILREQPDAVIFKYWMPFFAPAFGTIGRLLRRRGIRVLAIVHNAIPHEPRWGDAALSRYFLRTCDGLIALSSVVKEEIRSLNIKTSVSLVGHPVYSNFGQPKTKEEARQLLGLPADAPVLLFFGLIRHYKGLQVLLEAMPQVLRTLPQTRLVIAGEFYGSPQNTLDTIALQQLQDRIVLHDRFIEDDQVKTYFCACDLVVQPYLSASQSGVAQIAYHFNRPLVVTDVGGLAEIVPHEKAGLVVPPQNPQALAAAICRFFVEQMAPQLQRGVAEEKRKYSWERLYEAIEALLQRQSSA